MNSRERVLAAMNHKQPDRVPIDCGGHRSSNFSIAAYKNLRNYLGLPPDTLYVYDVIQQLVIPGDDVLEILGIDVIDLGRDFRSKESYWKDWVQHDGTEVKIPAYVDLRDEGNDTWMYNSKGSRIAVQKERCLYFEQITFPRMDNQTRDFSDLEDNFHDIMWLEVAGPPFPLGYEGADMELRKTSAQEIREKSNRAIYGLFGGNFFEAAQYMYRIDNALFNFAAEPEMIRDFCDNMLEIHKVNLKKYLDACGDELDVIGFGDDLGMQKGPQISPAMFREKIKPYYVELWGYAKKLKPNIKLCMHCCGGVEPLLEDIIDAGMDAINPVQISCSGMEPKMLKEKYGKDITFWGGGCDTRDILPNGTPQEIRDHVYRNLDEWFKDGGFVFQQVHNILSNIPPENIMAMFEAVRTYA